MKGQQADAVAHGREPTKARRQLLWPTAIRFLLLAVCATILVAGGAYLFWAQRVEQIETKIFRDQALHSGAVQGAIEAELLSVSGQLSLFLGHLSDTRSLEAPTATSWHALERRFIRVLNAHPGFMHLAVLSKAGDSGLHIARTLDGPVRAPPGAWPELHLDQLKRGLALSPGTLSITHLADPTHVHKDRPSLGPIVRFLAPLELQDGTRWGVLMIDVATEAILPPAMATNSTMLLFRMPSMWCLHAQGDGRGHVTWRHHHITEHFDLSWKNIMAQTSIQQRNSGGLFTLLKIEPERVNPNARDSVPWQMAVFTSSAAFEDEVRVTMRGWRLPFIFSWIGSLLASLVVAMSWSRRIFTEGALRRRRAHHLKLLEATHTVAWIFDIAHHRFSYFGPQFETVTGYAPTPHLQLDRWSQRIHPEDRAAALALYERPTQLGRDHTVEFRMLTPDNRTVWISQDVTPATDAMGAPHLMGYLRDITTRREAQANVDRQRLQLQSYLNQDLVGFAVFSKNLKIVDLNEFMLRLLKVERSAVIGQPFHTFVMAQDAHALSKQVEVLFAGEISTFSAQIRMVSPDGRIIHTLSQITMLDADQALAITLDITEQAATQDLLYQAQRLESLGTLTGGIAHDFNNILGAIIGNTELGQMMLDDGESPRACLEEVMTAAQRARMLVGQMLAFARRTEGQVVPVTLSEIVKEAVNLVRAVTPATVQITTTMSADRGVVEGDPTQLHQVVMNLCTNAAQAMAVRGGHLNVHLSSEPAPAHLAHLAPDRYLRLQIQDDGPGISATLQGKIFDPFFTTKPKGRGTGLGLAVVHGVITRHQGTITVDSVVGEGSTFTVYLPQHHDDTGHITNSEIEAVPHGDAHILLVDDDAALAQITGRILETLGYTVTIRLMPEAAIDAYKAAPDRFDLLLTDLAMPVMTGDTLMARLHAIRPDLPVLICTGYSDHLNEESAIARGAAGLLEKPLQRATLARAIHAALADTPTSLT